MKTMILLHALEKAKDADRKKLLDLLDSNNRRSSDIEGIIALFRKTGSIAFVEKKAKSLVEEAKKELRKCNVEKNCFHFFEELADYVILREQ